MKKLLQLIVSLFLLSTSYAQEKDFFVKTSGDTVQCTINRVSDDYLFYSIANTRTRIEMEQVATYSISEQDVRETPMNQDAIYDAKESFEEQNQNRRLIEAYTNQYSEKSKSLRMTMNGGAGLRIARASDDLPKKYINQLRWGFNYSAKFQAFDRSDRGFGIEFNQFLNTTHEKIPQIGDVKDDISISYFGISYLERQKMANNVGYVDFGLGVLFYKNNQTIDGFPILIEGFTLGVTIQYSYDIAISESFNLSLNSGIIAGKLTSVEINGATYTTQNPEDGEGLVRINAGLGLSFTK